MKPNEFITNPEDLTWANCKFGRKPIIESRNIPMTIEPAIKTHKFLK